MIAFLTGIANDFDVELARVLSSNGFKVYTRNADQADKAAAFAELIDFDPDSADSIDQACEALLKAPGCIDLYVDTSDYKSPKDNFTVSDDIDYEVMKEVYTRNALRPIGIYEGFQPLMSKGELKRFCYITGAEASNNLCTAIRGYGYNMSKAGLHNFLQIARNKMVPEGYTFRAFDPMTGKLAPQDASKSAFYYFTRRRGVEGGRDDEPRLVIRDALGRQQSW